MILLAVFVVVWIACLIVNPVATLVITFAVSLFGGIFMTSGSGDGGTGSRWGGFW